MLAPMPTLELIRQSLGRVARQDKDKSSASGKCSTLTLWGEQDITSELKTMRESAIPQHPSVEENLHQMATLLLHHVRDDLVGQRSGKQDDVEQHVHRVHVDTNISKI